METFPGLVESSETAKKLGSAEIAKNILQQTEGIEILPENRNEKGELLAPNGNVSNLQNELHWKMVRTPLFKEWFGSSDVIDENDEPALVYHSTNASLDNFEEFQSKDIEKSSRFTETGHYFTSGQQVYGKNRLSVFLNARLTMARNHWDVTGLQEETKKDLTKKGYTGISYSFDNYEKEINNKKQYYRKNFHPKKLSDFIYYGFNKLNFLSYKMHKDPEELLQEIKKDNRDLIATKKDAKSPFYEVVVFEPDQIMIADKEKDIYHSVKLDSK